MADYKVSQIKVKEGDEVPRGVLRMRTDGETTKLTTDQLFKGKKVILFSLPGAFTSVCSAKHLPQVRPLVPSCLTLSPSRSPLASAHGSLTRVRAT
jgi:hypothetical protein